MVGVVLQGKWLVDSNIVTFFQPYKRDVFFFFFEMTAAAYFLDGVKHGFIPPSRSRLAMIGHVMRSTYYIYICIIILCYIILYYTIFYFIMLYYIILYFILLYCIILYSIVLYYIVCGLMLCVPTPTLNGMGPRVARPARLFKSYF